MYILSFNFANIIHHLSKKIKIKVKQYSAGLIKTGKCLKIAACPNKN